MKKTILITGSTDGIGKLAGLKLAKEGHRVLLHGRNASKLSRVLEATKKETNNDQIDGFVADFSDLQQVSKMGEDLIEKIGQVDVLINNAGVFKSAQTLTKQGLDIRMVVNYLAPYLLTHKLINQQVLKAGSRVINLSSAAQSTVSMDLLDGKRSVSDQEAYAQSKLALLMWSFYLAAENSEIAVIALNPGSLLNTNMVREAYGKFWSSADKGADIMYDLALEQNIMDKTGQYFDNDRGAYGPAHPDAYTTSLIEALIARTNLCVPHALT